MGKLVFNGDDDVEVPDGERIQPFCEEAGIPFACEEGICGTCIIEVEEGGENLSLPTREEYDFLGDPGTERLACQCKIQKGCVKIRF
ncbi:MAG: ferredoxin [Chlamydiae bacterium RIFCSPHIGHO2_12_FULL_49_11]|nr:MAG: ferredoxin [Chlamydiae bacterium RIFCSPHIGHO2_12_FULL_49_11]